jgi:hypothetical protein
MVSAKVFRTAIFLALGRSEPPTRPSLRLAHCEIVRLGQMWPGRSSLICSFITDSRASSPSTLLWKPARSQVGRSIESLKDYSPKFLHRPRCAMHHRKCRSGTVRGVCQLALDGKVAKLKPAPRADSHGTAANQLPPTCPAMIRPCSCLRSKSLWMQNALSL